MGRVTREQLFRAISLVKAGHSCAGAARICGVHRATISAACVLAGVTSVHVSRKKGEPQKRRRTTAGQRSASRSVTIIVAHLGNPQWVDIDTTVPGSITLRAAIPDEATGFGARGDPAAAKGGA